VIWGVKPVFIEKIVDNPESIEFIKELLRNDADVKDDGKVIYIYNQKTTESESANSIQIIEINT
jgi:hypothetical protein